MLTCDARTCGRDGGRRADGRERFVYGRSRERNQKCFRRVDGGKRGETSKSASRTENSLEASANKFVALSRLFEVESVDFLSAGIPREKRRAVGPVVTIERCVRVLVA